MIQEGKKCQHPLLLFLFCEKESSDEGACAMETLDLILGSQGCDHLASWTL